MAEMILKCGLDEAGRGPIAGPVTAGCVVLPSDFPVEILNDSKKLTEKKREAAFEKITETACWGLGVVDHATIDRINILEASMLAMKIAFNEMLEKLPSWASARKIADYRIVAMTDGLNCPEVDCEVRAEPKADGKYPEVMAASIVAKVSRDRIMREFDALYPEYGYAGHKGYPTAKHLEICRRIGPSPIQRLTFNIEKKGGDGHSSLF